MSVQSEDRENHVKIRMVVPSLVQAGMETVTLDLAVGLIKAGYEVGITCLDVRGNLHVPAPPLGPVVDVVRPGRTLKPAALTGHFREVDPDVIHAHSGTAFLAALAARAIGHIPLIYTVHGRFDQPGIPWQREWIERLTCRWYDKVVGVSPDLKRYIQRRLWVPTTRAEVVVNGIDVTRFADLDAAEDLRGKLGIQPTDLVIGTVARLSRVKDQAALVRSFAEYHRSDPDSWLLLAGDGPLRPELERLADDLGVADRTRFLGHLADPRPVYRALDIFALTSTNEGLSISLLEAMAAGVITVATPVGGNPWLLADGARGYLLEAPTPASIATAFRRIRTNPTEVERKRTAAGEAVHRSFSTAAMVSCYGQLYDNLVAA